MLTPPKPAPRRAAFAASRAFRTPVASCSVVPSPPMCMKKTCGRSKKKWLCSAVTWSPLSRAALIVGFTCGSVSVMSPMTIVVSPAAWNAAQVVRPWNGCIFAPSMTAPRSPRGTLIFAMPFFTSGLRPVIFAISSASSSSAATLLAMTTARTSNSSTRIVFMTSLLSSSSFVSSVRDAAPDLASTEEKPKAEQRDQGEGHALPAAQDPVARAQAPGEAPERDERHGKPEQDVERDGALQTEQVCQPIVQAVPEGRVRAEVGARITDAREDRRHQTGDGRPEQPGRVLRHALVRPHEERAHAHRLEHEKGDREVDQERMPLRPRRGNQREKGPLLPWWMPPDATGRDRRGRRRRRSLPSDLQRDLPQLVDRLIAEERRRERAIRLDEVGRREPFVPEHVPERRGHHHDGEGKRIPRELLPGRIDRVRRLDRIDQHLDDRNPALPQVRLEGLQVLQLHRTDRAPAREEVHDDGLADEISRREGLAIEGLRLEAGKGAAPELFRDGRDERLVGAIDGQADGERPHDQQGPMPARHPPHRHCPTTPLKASPIRPAATMTSGSGTFFT